VALRGPFERALTHLHAVLRLVGKAAVDSAETVVLLEGKIGAEAKGCRFLLLTDAAWKPLRGTVVQCDVLGLEAGVREVAELQLPFVLCIRTRQSLLSSHYQSIAEQTCDTLALELAQACGEAAWEARLVRWKRSGANRDLLSVTVEGFGEVLETPLRSRASAAARAFCADLEAIPDGDPLAVGREAGARWAPGVGAFSSSSASGGPLAAEAAEAELFWERDEDALAGLGCLSDACLDDVHECLREAATGIDEERALRANAGAPPLPEDDVGPDGGASDPEAEQAVVLEVGAAAAADAEGAPAGPAVPAAAAVAFDMVSLAHVDDRGIVTCADPAWVEEPMIGRVTRWQRHGRENISAKCFMHPACSSPARLSSRTPERTFLRWLLEGERVGPEAPREARLAAAKRHFEAFARVEALDRAEFPDAR